MRNNDEVLAEIINTLFVENLCNLNKLEQLIDSAQNPAQFFQNSVEDLSILHMLLNTLPIDQAATIVFIKKYSKYINLNIVCNNQTVLHLIAEKGYDEIADALFTTNLQFVEKPNLFVRDDKGNKPIDLAKDKTKTIFEEAMLSDFTSRIVLVHPLQPNSILDCLFKVNKEHLIAYDMQGSMDLLTTTVNAVVRDNTMLTDEALIGAHLAFNRHQYTNTFVDRPHIHWWWNGLFQANSGGDWENSLVAFLEPLDSVKNVMGCAPYDTMTMGSHQLSKNSCILVPNYGASLLRERLKNYQGRIIAFDPSKQTLRDAINHTLHNEFPYALKLTDKNGHDINQLALSDGDKHFNRELAAKMEYNCNMGYFQHLYVHTGVNQYTPLLRGENGLIMNEYKHYAQNKFVGLHRHSPTDVESNRLIKIVQTISIAPEKIQQYMRHFIGQSGIKNQNDLCILEAFKIYTQLISYGSSTGAHDYASYLLKKALIIDFKSIHGRVHDKIIQPLIDGNYQTLLKHINILSNACNLPNDSELNDYKQSQLEEYRLFLNTMPELIYTVTTTPQTFYFTSFQDNSAKKEDSKKEDPMIKSLNHFDN